MKKGLLIIGLLLMHNLLISQTLVDTTKKWNTMGISEMGFEFGSELIRFGKDTTVDATIYKKVLRATNEIQPDWASYGLIRETSDKKIYYRTDTSNQEYLLYDFGLTIDDTVTPTALDSYNSGENISLRSYPLIVRSIDSILVGGTLRKQLHLGQDFMGETDQWVEGMGSRSGMLHCNFGFVGGDTYKLMCFYQNDSLFWLNPSYTDCFFIESIIEEISHKVTFSINPDPVTDVSIISIKNTAGNKSMKLEIFSCTGEKIQTKDVKDGMEINRNDFIPGIYLFRLTIGSDRIRTIKVSVL